MSDPTKVLLIEDDRRIADGVRAILAAPGRFAVEVAGTIREARLAIPRFVPGVLLIDLGLPDGDGVDLVRSLRRDRVEAQMLVLTSATTPDRIMDALRAGAHGYLFKDDLDTRLVPAIDELLAGGAPLSSGAARVVLGELDVQAQDQRPQLTGQEARVLEWLSIGHGYEEMARDASLSINTIRTHVRSLYAKLGVENRAEAVNLAWRLGLLRKPAR
jgi:DNA-binding NarL/FixJ family response regulator